MRLDLRDASGKAVAFIGGLFAWAVYGCVRLLGKPRALRLAGAPAFSRNLARLVNFVIRKKNHCFERNLRLVFPGISAEQITELDRQVWANNAKTLVETAWLSDSDFPQVTIQGKENLAAAGDGGIIFVSAHVHSLYYPHLCTKHLGYPVAFLHRAMTGRLQQAFARHLIGWLGVAVPSTQTKRFITHLRQGGNVGIMPDLRVKGGKHCARLTLCGHPAWTSTFVAELALTYRRPIVPVYMNRRADGSLEFIIEPAIDQSSGDRLVITQLINDSMGARILAQPGAWALWNTNRWGP
jgi:lauroyl/myristoyl acyltransferase